MPKKKSTRAPIAIDRHFRTPIYKENLPDEVYAEHHVYPSREMFAKKMLEYYGNSDAFELGPLNNLIAINSSVPQSYYGEDVNSKTPFETTINHELVHALQRLKEKTPAGIFKAPWKLLSPREGLGPHWGRLPEEINAYDQLARYFDSNKEAQAYILSDTLNYEDHPKAPKISPELQRKLKQRMLDTFEAPGVSKDVFMRYRKIWE